MSRNRKDGRKGGGHHKTRELWSARFRKVAMDVTSKWAKRLTHRYERRLGKKQTQELS